MQKEMRLACHVAQRLEVCNPPCLHFMQECVEYGLIDAVITKPTLSALGAM